MDHQPAMYYAPSEHWNRRFREFHLSGADLDWGERWTGAFVKPLRQANVHTVLDLGCGTGNDVLRLTRAGFKVTEVDYSEEAICQAQFKASPEANFLVADMVQSLPFPVSSFGAVMSNVALHMFPDAITRAIFLEVQRIVRPGGLFLFHVNSMADRPLRAKRKTPVRELESDFILEQDGQTMHFFFEGISAGITGRLTRNEPGCNNDPRSRNR
jgi:SAM-dependent methyltransferase